MRYWIITIEWTVENVKYIRYSKVLINIGIQFYHSDINEHTIMTSVIFWISNWNIIMVLIISITMINI